MNTVDTVLITGASSGIGYELAQVFALHKHNLILVSRNTEKLGILADKLAREYHVRVDVIGQDLAKLGAAEEVYYTVKKMQLQVDILINNAGVGKVGLFHEIDQSNDLEMMQTNMSALTELTKVFARDMIQRRKGKILNVASTGAFSPGPFTAVYYATKAYVLSLSEALYLELKPYNITVATLCPGATRTNFAKIAGKKDVPGAMEASVVAKIAYESLKKNKKIIVPGMMNKLLIKLPRHLVSKINFKWQKNLSSK